MSCRARRLPTLLLVAVLATACSPAPRPPSPIPAPVPAPVPVQPDEPTAPRPAEGTLIGGNGALWYHITGTGADTVLVPLGSWLERPLARLGDGHVVVFYDPRHRGRSHALADSAAGTFDGDVADLEAVRTALGISRMAVIGFDYYAGVAAAWAAAHPRAVTRLVLLSPIEPADSLSRGWNPDRMSRLDTAAARALVKDRAAGRDTTDAAGYCAAFWRVNAPIFVADTARAPALGADWCTLANESPSRIAASAGLALASLGTDADIGARAAGLSAPMLVIHGRQDLVANPEGARVWAGKVPGARLLWLSNVGHLPHLEAGPVVVDAIADFLAGRWPPRAVPPESSPH